jgi:nitric oxide reductase subunit B
LVILTVIAGFTILIWLSVGAYRDAPPIPRRAVSRSGQTIFTRQDSLEGQQVFLKYGLMENGTIAGVLAGA